MDNFIDFTHTARTSEMRFVFKNTAGHLSVETNGANHDIGDISDLDGHSAIEAGYGNGYTEVSKGNFDSQLSLHFYLGHEGMRIGEFDVDQSGLVQNFEEKPDYLDCIRFEKK